MDLQAPPASPPKPVDAALDVMDMLAELAEALAEAELADALADAMLMLAVPVMPPAADDAAPAAEPTTEDAAPWTRVERSLAMLEMMFWRGVSFVCVVLWIGPGLGWI